MGRRRGARRWGNRPKRVTNVAAAVPAFAAVIPRVAVLSTRMSRTCVVGCPSTVFISEGTGLAGGHGILDLLVGFCRIGGGIRRHREKLRRGGDGQTPMHARSPERGLRPSSKEINHYYDGNDCDT